MKNKEYWYVDADRYWYTYGTDNTHLERALSEKAIKFIAENIKQELKKREANNADARARWSAIREAMTG